MNEKKLLVCPDSFKGTLTAAEAGHVIAKGLDGFPTEVIPVADGGEGTLDALCAGGARATRTVFDPLFRRIGAEYGVLPGKEPTAVIETARAAGLTLLSEEERCAGATTTYGVGELIADALGRGIRKVLLTVGGSATNDGGCGMMAALGAVFRDGSGKSFVPTGFTLGRISSVDFSSVLPALFEAEITVAADVRNPLLGPAGATAVYGKQKGGSSFDLIEAGMAHYASLLPRPVASLPGAGAAGGIAAPLLALTGAKIVPGIDAVLDAVGFDERLRGAFLVITGEGRTDAQSVCGKAVFGVSRRAAKHGVPVFCLSGGIAGDREALKRALGLAGLFALTDRYPLGDCLKNPAILLEETARSLSGAISAYRIED